MNNLGVVLLGVLVVVLYVGALPALIAWNLVVLFSLPFWPCFWLALFTSLAIGGIRVKRE